VGPVGVGLRVRVRVQETVSLRATSLVSDSEAVGVCVLDLVTLVFNVADDVAVVVNSGLSVKDFEGDGGVTVRVRSKVKDGEQERLQVDERVGGVIERLIKRERVIVCENVWVPEVDGDAVVLLDVVVVPVCDGLAVTVRLSVHVLVGVRVGLREVEGLKDGEGTPV